MSESDITVTIRGVDSKAWKEFQRGIVSLHGNLYGNIGQELTIALKLWLERCRGMESAIGVPADRLSVSYDDIGGLKEEIRMIKEAVEIPLRHTELFKWLDLIPLKGSLFLVRLELGRTYLLGRRRLKLRHIYTCSAYGGF